MVTGGAGYIGSHAVLELLLQGHSLLVVDNFYNSSFKPLKIIEEISKKNFQFSEVDLENGPALCEPLKKFQPEAVIHFAGLKSVAQSVENPLLYYRRNLNSTIQLLEALDIVNCKKVIFSSSATVYGTADYLPFDEEHPLNPINPYGRSKLFIEKIIRDWVKTDKEKSALLLRYFNPVGAHHSGKIGESPLDVPNNLVPLVAQVAMGLRQKLSIFGQDYDTLDGTGIRDYIHVSDLVKGHVSGLSYIFNLRGVDAINLGTGVGYSVKQVISSFSDVSGKEIPYETLPRRNGDIACSLASVKKAKALLGWEAELGIDRMCRDVWNWQLQNSNGFEYSETELN